MKLSNLLYAGMLSSLALVSCTDNDENSEWTGSEGVVYHFYSVARKWKLLECQR